ncbi:hypothetical protein K0M31_003579 [Melipona bicolor]|uniref:Uncharacterized protein n=1 Tax=Melipona bicolor TaxID=60889 RepID=A0AA40KPL8_9HYME|nr:hypothetical protein K0M31_003579 [Melipona bicolor]
MVTVPGIHTPSNLYKLLPSFSSSALSARGGYDLGVCTNGTTTDGAIFVKTARKEVKIRARD